MIRLFAPQLLIFDWDGTLCDSLLRITQSIQRSADDIGLPVPSMEDARDIVGLGLVDAVQILFPGIDEAQIQRFKVGYSRHFLADKPHSSPLYPYVMETLTGFRDRGYLLAVATGKSRSGLQQSLIEVDLQDFFHGSRCADETRSKPDPLMLQELLAEFSVVPEQALMVGDTSYDMEMAQRAGVARLAMSYGAHDEHRLRTYSPIECLDCFSKITRFIG